MFHKFSPENDKHPKGMINPWIFGNQPHNEKSNVHLNPSQEDGC